MTALNPFPEELQWRGAGMINGRRHIIVDAPFPCITSLGRITVPRGFVCDGGSIPRFAWSIIGHPFDEFLEDAVLHDWLYSPFNYDFTRAEADHLFKETMWNRDIARPKIAAMYCAVRLFGWRGFKGQPI